MAANARKALPWIAVTAAVALAAVLFLTSREAPDAPPPPLEEAAAPAPEPASAPASPPRPLASPPPAEAFASPAPGVGATPPLPAQVPEPEEGPPKPYPVDLEKLRERLPDNLYWEVAAPTKDPEVLKRRDAEARRWNDQYGKVLAGTATEAEVREYYAHRKKLSEDFLAFATTVLNEYGGELPERDQGLYQLSIDMHRTRLEELPRQEADSLAHREAQARRREAWRQGQPTP